MSLPLLQLFRFLLATLLFSLLGGVHSLHVDTPLPVSECGTTKFTWSGGQAPYTLHLRFQTNSSVAQEFDNLTGTTVPWIANVSAGTELYLELLDSSNNSTSSFSGSFNIQPGNDSCLSATSSSSAPTGMSTSNDSSTAQPNSSSASPPVPTSSAQPSNSVDAGSLDKNSGHALSRGAIAGIAVGSAVGGLLVALVLFLVCKRRRKSTSRPKIAPQRPLDTYRYSESYRSDDGWSAHDGEDELRDRGRGTQRDGAAGGETAPSWDSSLFVREKESSPPPAPPSLPPTSNPLMTTQANYHYPPVPRPLSSYPPLIPTSASESESWGGSPSSRASVARSSTNPFRARMLAAAASSDTGQAGVYGGGNW